MVLNRAPNSQTKNPGKRNGLFCVKAYLVIMDKSTIILVPGLGNSDEKHWQTYWEKKYGFGRVNQQDWERPIYQDWVETLDKTVTQYNPAEVILVGHSLACATIVGWAGKYKRSIKAAMLVAPADTEAPDFPPEVTGFAPMPLQELSFPSVVVASTNDEYVTLDRARYFADCWESQFVNIGAAGHINSDSDLKDWPIGMLLMRQLEQSL